MNDSGLKVDLTCKDSMPQVKVLILRLELCFTFFFINNIIILKKMHANELVSTTF